jgi:hypothetical protein
MTTPPNLQGDEWGRWSHPMHERGQVLSRGQARRMSRRFAGVGVGIPAVRLQEIAAGAPVAGDELADVNFALAATELKREARLATFQRGRRRCMRWLIASGMVLVVLNLLLCVACIFFSLAQHTSPF